MSPGVVITGDGSHTLFHDQTGEHYHSTFGALTESMHVYINAGFRSLHAGSDPIHILEAGFGTGLNALLTLIEAERSGRQVFYDAIEPCPIDPAVAVLLNYLQILSREDLTEAFAAMHSAPADLAIALAPLFTIRKMRTRLEEKPLQESLYDLVYFDAFSPNVQPELWRNEVFDALKAALKPGGVLVTYCSRGSVARAMETAGFTVSRMPGPPGKRHIIRAIRK